MQEWMIAMLVISVLLILRDMAKTFFTGKKHRSQEIAVTEELVPRRIRGEKYASAFRKLAESYYEMPYRKDCFSDRQLEEIGDMVWDQVCACCGQRTNCWERQYEETAESLRQLIRAMESGSEETLQSQQEDFRSRCAFDVSFFQALEEGVRRERENLAFQNRLIENRLAVAGQLMETSGILKAVSQGGLDPQAVDPQFQNSLKKSLKKRQIYLKKAWMLGQEAGPCQFFLTVKARRGRCIAMKEVARALSEECGSPMVPADSAKSIVNSEYATAAFVEDSSYQVQVGTARIPREGEAVSGDNFSCCQDEDRFVLCLSDGMGTGRAASQESMQVVELLEQFLESGFSLETSARMVNSTLLLKGPDTMFSTMDLCAVDLRTGICSFLKAGAATTFILRDHWVESIASENLALGLVQQMEFEKTVRKLYHGDVLIMLSDGIIDALPVHREEELLREMLLELKESTPAQMGRDILERVLGYCDYHPRDDMTILVAGIRKK